MVLFSIIHTLLIIHTLYIIRIIKWTIMYYSVFITKEVATITITRVFFFNKDLLDFGRGVAENLIQWCMCYIDYAKK